MYKLWCFLLVFKDGDLQWCCWIHGRSQSLKVSMGYDARPAPLVMSHPRAKLAKKLSCKDQGKSNKFVHILRRQSTGFSRGSSNYKGVTLHKCGKWKACTGQFLEKKHGDAMRSSKIVLDSDTRKV
ncbi:hypothetical protein RIF29_40559 [Crotalaria pallida]|uniref:Uncharacterized protein n=1 Tax=Crotalaria pallida TaxID=3830 RepID=A0AAN9E8S1_CROPI